MGDIADLIKTICKEGAAWNNLGPNSNQRKSLILACLFKEMDLFSKQKSKAVSYITSSP